MEHDEHAYILPSPAAAIIAWQSGDAPGGGDTGGGTGGGGGGTVRRVVTQQTDSGVRRPLIQ